MFGFRRKKKEQEAAAEEAKLRAAEDTQEAESSAGEAEEAAAPAGSEEEGPATAEEAMEEIIKEAEAAIEKAEAAEEAVDIAEPEAEAEEAAVELEEELAEPEEEVTEPEEEKTGFFGRLSMRLSEAFSGNKEVDDDLFDELEEILITSDIGMETTMNIMERLRFNVRAQSVRKAEDARRMLRQIMTEIVDKGERQEMSKDMPLIILMIGINGGGKTTTIGKLGARYLKEGRSVLFVAGDTFRAAAADQLKIWADRVGVGVVSHQEGADPSAVLYDGIQSAKSKGTDVVICDTAGRLQNKKNLMQELEKMNRIIDREFPEASRETLLVLDATTGKNAVSQVKEFGEVADLSGIVITKLDGTAKGGIAITIADEFDMPVKFIGVGEKLEDLRAFDPAGFIGGIFDE